MAEVKMRCRCPLWTDTKGCCLDKREDPKPKSKNRKLALQKIRVKLKVGQTNDVPTVE